jgi:hypothetical protein
VPVLPSWLTAPLWDLFAGDALAAAYPPVTGQCFSGPPGLTSAPTAGWSVITAPGDIGRRDASGRGGSQK